MKRYLVTIEFRYKDVTPDLDTWYRRDKITIGVYNNPSEAYSAGNEVLQVLESRFDLNPNYNIKRRFSAKGGCFNGPEHLISNLGYLVTPFEFYAEIKTLSYGYVEDKITQVLASVDSYKTRPLNQE